MPPVLFLDIDGVLNNDQTREINADDGSTGIDPANVVHLNALCRALPDLRIVVSSSWRLNHELPELRDSLARAGFRFIGRVTDITPRWMLDDQGYVVDVYEWRGDEILAWLAANGEPPFVVLDDSHPFHDNIDPSRHRVVDRWVRPRSKTGGMSVSHVVAIMALLAPDRSVT